MKNGSSHNYSQIKNSNSQAPFNLWRFSTAWYGTVRYGSLLGGFPLGTVPGTWYFFSTTSVEVPCKPYRYQNVTCKLCWSLISLRKSSLLRHWTCDTRPSSTALPARFKSAQPAKDRTQLLFKQTHIFCINHKIAVSLSVEEEQTFLSLIAEERIQWELDGATPKEKALCITLLLNLLYLQSMFSVYILPLYLCCASIKNNLIE